MDTCLQRPTASCPSVSLKPTIQIATWTTYSYSISLCILIDYVDHTYVLMYINIFLTYIYILIQIIAHLYKHCGVFGCWWFHVSQWIPAESYWDHPLPPAECSVWQRLNLFETLQTTPRPIYIKVSVHLCIYIINNNNHNKCVYIIIIIYI